MQTHTTIITITITIIYYCYYFQYYHLSKRSGGRGEGPDALENAGVAVVNLGRLWV